MKSKVRTRQRSDRAKHGALIGALAASAAIMGATGLAIAPASASTRPLAPARVGSEALAPSGARALGALAPSTHLSMDVVLQPRNSAALANYAAEVSTPGSAIYRQYLPAGAFPARFGPSASAIASVRSTLAAEGLRVGALSSNHLSITVSGTAAQFEQAWSIGFTRYDIAGRTAFGNTRGPLLPGAVAHIVQGVVGLQTIVVPHHEALLKSPLRTSPSTTPHVSTGGPQPCSAASSAGSSEDSYTADQIASAYKFSSLYGASDFGAGQTVGLFELEPNKTSDISAYQSCYGTSATVNYIKEDGGAGSGAGAGEAALDIEDVIGLAPDATIDVYQAPNSNTGLYDNYSAMVSSDTAKEMSTSWGECESESGTTITSEENTLFEQAATQGQSIYAAAGDSGAEDCGTSALAVDDPASQPYVTGVGGTEMTAIGPPPTQKVWNEKANGSGAGGGGISTLWKMPSYQTGAPSSLNVINSASSGTPCGVASGSYCREVPDVSADADPYSGYVIYYDGSWTGIGGTSAAAPLWAAFTALTNASSSCKGTGIGFANPDLYDAAATAYSSDFSDITSGNNDYTGSKGFSAGTGYDMASGLGTPIGSTLPATLCGGGSTGNTVTVTNPGTQTTTVGSAVSLQIAATDSGGASLTFTASGLPAGLSISSSGLISGSPTTAGSSSVTVTAKDSTGASGSTSFTWTVNSKGTNTVTVTNPHQQRDKVGKKVSLQIAATDSGGLALTFTATGLPPGLTISSSGLITGAPTTHIAGGYKVTVTATDSTGASGSASFAWKVPKA
ncbi:MAG: putative Ig domain-containing protein [Acidimicrobiales bacterium]